MESKTSTAILLFFILTCSLQGALESPAIADSWEDGVQYMKQGDEFGAFKHMKKAAEEGHPGAQGLMGLWYSQGKIVPQDYPKAVKWYTKAAEQGFSMAQTNLGLMYGKGIGVPQDYTKAVYWLRKSAEQNDVQAQMTLAISYKDGLGVPKDDEESVYWVKKVLKQRWELEKNNLGYIYLEAVNMLAAFYTLGRGVEKDLNHGRKLFIQSAEYGNSLAQFNLGNMYFEGFGADENNLQACFWMNLAANQGHPGASENLAEIEAVMSPKEIKEVQKRVRGWKPKVWTP